MKENNDVGEQNPLVPSGEWSGFYLEEKDNQTCRGWMHLYLRFDKREIQGEGADYVGPWVISGEYDLDARRASWTKRYLKKHHVKYTGIITEQGIVGKWNIHLWNEGPFHIWPRPWFELENLYLAEDQAGRAPSILAGTVPVSPHNAA